MPLLALTLSKKNASLFSCRIALRYQSGYASQRACSLKSLGFMPVLALNFDEK